MGNCCKSLNPSRLMTNKIMQDNVNEFCHPHLRMSFKTNPVCKEFGNYCSEKSLPCDSCCLPVHDHQPTKAWAGKGVHYDQTSCLTINQPNAKNEDESKQHLHHVAHSCPPGKIVLCEQDHDGYEKDIIKAVELCSLQPKYDDRVPDEYEEAERETERVRPCCAKKSSWTEPRICRCDMSDPIKTSQNCECECGAFIPKPKKAKKRVRFDDQVTTHIDCDHVFKKLHPNDIKDLCRCCKECAVKDQDQCVCKPVLVYELPEAKFEDKSVTQNDFSWKKTQEREIPPWHPNIKDRWHQIDVPSLAETTYQCDFKPPPVLHGERKPVYLAPQREERRDPCQQLAEEYSAFKKTSTRPSHVYHSSCEKCDKDLHRVHLHECEVSHLPPQYQCHGDGHICEPTHQFHLDQTPEFKQDCHLDHSPKSKNYCSGDDQLNQGEDMFTLGEAGDTGKSKYWWKRTCCTQQDRITGKSIDDVPPDLMKPACPDYTTIYTHDYKSPVITHNGRMNFENCSSCEYCKCEPSSKKPHLLCTKNQKEGFITQQTTII